MTEKTTQQQNLNIVNAYMAGYPIFWSLSLVLDSQHPQWERVNSDHIFDFRNNVYKEGELVRGEVELTDANDNIFQVNYGLYVENVDANVEKLLGIDSPSEGTITLSLNSLKPLIEVLEKLEAKINCTK